MATGWPMKTTYADGDVYSAQDVNDITGTINLLQTSTLSRSAGKNAIINGGMDIWQRGTTVTGFLTPTSIYSADRWFGSNNLGMTISRQATGDTTNLPNIQYCARIQRNNLSVATNLVGFSQSIETSNSIPYAGKTVMVSFYARVGANFSAGLTGGTPFTAALYSGTGTDQRRDYANAFTGEVTVASLTPTLTSTWQRFTLTGTIAATATELAFLAYYGASTAASGAADYFEITGVQVELGSYATTFSRAGGTIQGELAACQRYYIRLGGNAAYETLGSSYNVSTTAIKAVIALPVTMRVIPTSVDSSTICIQDSNDSISGTLTSVAIANAGTQQVRISATSSGLTDNLPGALLTNNSTSGYIGFSAEL
jgi:hypothetical protein